MEKKTCVFSGIALFLCMALAAGAAMVSCSSGSAGYSQNLGIKADGGSASSSAMASQPASMEKAAESKTSGLSLAAQSAQSEQKIIQNLTYQVETLEFDKSIQKIEELCRDLGGYVQESSVDGSRALQQNRSRNAHYVLRIPQEKLDSFQNDASGIGSILNFSRSSQNIGEQYFDKESRLKSLRAQQERLLELMKNSGTMEDLIALEKALTDTNQEIEQLSGELRQYDSLVSYSTVTISLHEVAEATKTEIRPVTLGEKIASRFQNSVAALKAFGEWLLIFLIGGFPVIFLLAVLAFAAVLIVRRQRKKRRAPKEKPQIPSPPAGTKNP